ncbi:endoglycosidase [Bacteroidia bacterium]|nr:endoglycosidase [Bacteroidia bacterium]
MKKALMYIAVVALAGWSVVGCSKWTESDPAFEPDNLPIGGGFDEEYYANLRAYKSTMHNRRIFFSWYGGWSAVSAYNYGAMAGLPDSMDVVAMWGTGGGMTEFKKRDMEYIQKVKGTRVIVTDLIGNLDTTKIKEFGWEGDLDPRGAQVNVAASGTQNMYSAPLTDVQEQALRKYARWKIQSILDEGYDGYDIDWELGWYSAGFVGTLTHYQERMRVYVDEISKFCGPKSGTDKLFVFDGAICYLPTPEMARCFDWLVIQAYDCASYTSLNTATNRGAQAVNRIKVSGMPIDSIIRKLVMTENYEKYGATGGRTPYTLEFPIPGKTVASLYGMAVWEPIYEGVRYECSGGCGAFHIEYEYESDGGGRPTPYPFAREAIQAMNPAQPIKK